MVMIRTVGLDQQIIDTLPIGEWVTCSIISGMLSFPPDAVRRAVILQSGVKGTSCTEAGAKSYIASKALGRCVSSGLVERRKRIDGKCEYRKKKPSSSRTRNGDTDILRNLLETRETVIVNRELRLAFKTKNLSGLLYQLVRLGECYRVSRGVYRKT